MARRSGIQPPAKLTREDALMRDWVEDCGFYVDLRRPVELEITVALDKTEIERPKSEIA
jgi:hypothetical protein